MKAAIRSFVMVVTLHALDGVCPKLSGARAPASPSAQRLRLPEFLPAVPQPPVFRSAVSIALRRASGRTGLDDEDCNRAVPAASAPRQTVAAQASPTVSAHGR